MKNKTLFLFATAIAILSSNTFAKGDDVQVEKEQKGEEAQGAAEKGKGADLENPQMPKIPEISKEDIKLMEDAVKILIENQFAQMVFGKMMQEQTVKNIEKNIAEFKDKNKDAKIDEKTKDMFLKVAALLGKNPFVQQIFGQLAQKAAQEKNQKEQKVAITDHLKEKPSAIAETGAPVLGNKYGKKEVTAFISMHCPHCQAAIKDFHDLAKKDPESKLNLCIMAPKEGIMHFASRAVVAMNKLGKFAPYFDKVKEKLASLTEEDLIKIAEELGVSREKFIEAMNDPENWQILEKTRELADKFKVMAAPTFVFGDGNVHTGKPEAAGLRAMFEGKSPTEAVAKNDKEPEAKEAGSEEKQSPEKNDAKAKEKEVSEPNGEANKQEPEKQEEPAAKEASEEKQE